jgi:hypothetical protein
MPDLGPPQEVAAIYSELAHCLDAQDEQGRIVGNARYGVYAFFDYDGEPIYVGQTAEMLRTRIRRHLTNRRTDAAAMSVLDPFEVLDIEMWPFWDLPARSSTPDGRKYIQDTLNSAEYTVYRRVLDNSQLKAVLNEKEIPVMELVPLPPSLRGRIVPNHVYELRKHPDIRIARRASTIASLARIISERTVKLGIRQTLLAQARRIEYLAAKRIAEFPANYRPPSDEDE